MMTKRTNSRGFSKIDLVVIVVCVVLLVGLILPSLQPAREKAVIRSPRVLCIANLNGLYNYWTLRAEADGDKVLVCDRNGLSNASNAVGAWGGNHDGEGGNYVKVSGEAGWAGTNNIMAMDGAMFNLSSNETGLGVVTNN